MDDVDDLFVVADLTLQTNQEDEVRCNIGDAQEGSGFSAASCVFGQDGFISAPNNPDANGACQCVYFQHGDEKLVIGTRDHRYQPHAGNIAEGDRLIVSNCSARVILKKEAASVTLYTTTDKTDNGRAIYFSISPAKGLEYSSPWGRMTFGPNGFHVLHASGARLDLGAIGGLPSPLDGIGSYARMKAGVVSVQGEATSVGTDGGAASEGGVDSLIQFLTELVANIATITTSTPGATAMAPMGALLTALPVELSPIGKAV